MAAWQVQEQTCYCPESVKVSGHVSSDIKTTWSKNVVKVSIGVIHTTRPDRPSISNVNVANRREIDVRHLPSSLLCYWLHPCEAWELFYSYHAGHRVTDYLTVSVEIDLKTSAARASPFETQKSSEAILRGIVHNLRRVTRAMADMVDVHQGPRLIPVLNITVDASNTPKQHADELCRFMMGLVGNIAALAKELPDTSDDAAAWYDLTVRSIIDIDIGRLRMADCGLEAKQLLRLNNVDQRWVSKLDYHVKLHHLDVSSNSIDGDDALQSKSHRGLSFLSILCLVCGTIPEVDISWNPTGCVTLLRKEFIISSTTRVIGAYAILPSEHNPTKTTVPPKRAHTNQLLRQGDHPKPSALEWEGILTTLLSSKIAETLKNIKGLKRYHGYIRVFGSALSGFSLPGSVSDVDAVVLLRDKETTIDAGLTEGKSSRWYKHSQSFVRRLSERLAHQPLVAYGRTPHQIKVVEVVAHARVPIIKLKLTTWDKDGARRSGQTVEVDLSFMNSLGVKNSELLREYGRLHCCVTPVVRAVKAWAKGAGLVSSMQNNFRRLSSYAWTMMVIFYLQVRVGILPSLQRPFNGKTRNNPTSTTSFYDSDDEAVQTAIFRREICPHFHDYGPDDEAQLFAGFFRFYGLGEFSYRNPVDITTAALENKSSQASRWDFLISPVINDPFLREKDLASNCHDWTIIRRALQTTAEQLNGSLMNDNVRRASQRETL